MTSRRALAVGFAFGLIAFLVFACVPVPPPSEVPPASVDTASELNDWLQDHRTVDLAGRVVRINDTFVSPPAGATISNGVLQRTEDRQQVTWPHVRISTTGVTLRDVTILGVAFSIPGQWAPIYDPTREEQHGVGLYGADSTLLERVQVRDVWGDALYLDWGTDGTVVRTLTATTMGRSGISNVDSTNTDIDGAFIDRTGLWLLNIEPFSTKRVDGLSVRHWATYRGSRGPWLFVGGPHYNCDVTDTTIEWPDFGHHAAFQHFTIDPCTQDLALVGGD